MARKILGISAFYHDSAAALAVDGEIVFATQEERFTRVKQDAAFPANAVRACLERGGKYAGTGPLALKDLDAVVFYEKPLLKFERLLETHYAFAPCGVRQFVTAMPVWIKEKLMLKKILRDRLAEIDPVGARDMKLLFPEHHLSHAASAFYPSPFDEAAILTVDGVGEWTTGLIGHGRGKNMQVLRRQNFPHSVGLLYSAFTYYAGFKVNSGEYKLMGLAPYGNEASPGYKKIRDGISALLDVKPDGSIRMNQDYFDYAAGLRMTNDGKWTELFGLPPRGERELTQPYCDLALAVQRVTEDILLRQAREAKRLTGSKNLCLAGGVALNCVANGRLQRENVFDKIWIQPASGDAGGALGAALAARHIYFGEERSPGGQVDGMRGSLLGPEYTEAEALLMAAGFGAVCEKLEDGELFPKVAELLDVGAIVGWHRGRAEFGPRALGNRSILGDPRSPDMQKKLNLKIKYRESFRPFAPSVLEEEAGGYFGGVPPSPYMLFTSYVEPGRRLPLPEGFNALPLKEKLYFLRSDIPAVTHLDYSARVQTVSAAENPAYHALLGAFKARTGCGVLVNTSFNVRGEPMVCTPEDAYRCFMGTEMDYLVVGNLLFDKKRQPAAPARREYAPD